MTERTNEMKWNCIRQKPHRPTLDIHRKWNALLMVWDTVGMYICCICTENSTNQSSYKTVNYYLEKRKYIQQEICDIYKTHCQVIMATVLHSTCHWVYLQECAAIRCNLQDLYHWNLPSKTFEHEQFLLLSARLSDPLWILKRWKTISIPI